MKDIELTDRILTAINQGMVYQNPQKGTSRIASISPEKIVYIRGNSRISLNIEVIHSVYQQYKGKKCSSNDLKIYEPKVFDSKQNGHSCNCTFLFTVLNEIGLTENGIEGEGKPYKPFYIRIKKDDSACH